MDDHQRFQASATDRGQRLDRFLAVQLPELSRVRVQELIRDGNVAIDGSPHRRPSQRLRGTESISVELRQVAPSALAPEDIPLEIIYEDDDLAVINKQAGLSVHPGAGRTTGTLVNALLHRFEQLSAIGGQSRPGIVHRLDRLTSGLMVVAKNDFAHMALAAQFQARSVEKRYIALVHGNAKAERGRIDTPVRRDLHQRVRMTTRGRRGRAAVTEYEVTERFNRWIDNSVRPAYTLLDVRIRTGRTHQIRVHLASVGHPVVGDRLYGAPLRLTGPGDLSGFSLGRPFLHSSRLTFVHPRSGQEMSFHATLAPELQRLLLRLRSASVSAGSGKDLPRVKAEPLI